MRGLDNFFLKFPAWVLVNIYILRNYTTKKLLGPTKNKKVRVGWPKHGSVANCQSWEMMAQKSSTRLCRCFSGGSLCWGSISATRWSSKPSEMSPISHQLALTFLPTLLLTPVSSQHSFLLDRSTRLVNMDNMQEPNGGFLDSWLQKKRWEKSRDERKITMEISRG